MKKKGYTLVEIIMVIVMVGVLVVGVAPFINAVVERWMFLQSSDEVVTQARNALDWMIREVREVKDSSSFAVAASNQLQFTNSNDVSISFSLSGTTLMRNGDELADYITGLQFEYRDWQNNVLSPLPLSYGQRENIRRIILTLTVATTGKTLTLQSDCFPRNLGG